MMETTMKIAKQTPISIIVLVQNLYNHNKAKKVIVSKIVLAFHYEFDQIVVLFYPVCIQQIQVMEINKPDKGIFKGLAPLQVERHINKKYFPRIRNIHQFEYTHYHPNDNVSSFQRFFSANKSTPIYQKVNKNTNQSSFQLGNDSNNYYNSLTKTDYKQFQRVKPPAPIRQKQQGIALGDQIPPSQHFMTTAMQKFGHLNGKQKVKVNFRDRGTQRFNPITGQMRTLSFGFEDFSMNRDNAYRANNCTYIPQKGEKVDIISGRKLTYK